jgi:hypothetical protein
MSRQNIHLGLNWSDIQPNRIYNAQVFRGDALYYSNKGDPIYDAQVVVLEKERNVFSFGVLPPNRMYVGISNEISKLQFENKIIFTYA